MRIIITTTGIGGHLFPAIELAKQLKKNNHLPLIIGTDASVNHKTIAENRIIVDSIPLKKPSKTLSFIISAIRSLWISLYFVHKVSPDIIIGFGGYASVPIILAGWLFKIPCIIHEQNVIPGKANKFLKNFTKKITISFAETKKYFPNQKVVFTGYPSKNIDYNKLSKENILKEFNLIPNKQTILITGGSQGSHILNQTIKKILPKLIDKYNIQAIHICGVKDYELLKKEYISKNLPIALFPFLNNITHAYFISDIVISRSGAGTIVELAQHKKPAILIPYPYANAHQKENALLLTKQNAAILCEEKDLSADLLKKQIIALLKDKKQTKTKDIYTPDACNRLMQVILSLKNK